MTFCQMVEGRDTMDSTEDIVRAFKEFDKDGNGKISCNELKHIMQVMGEKLTNEEIKEIFDHADLNHDGEIDYEEFVTFWKNL